MAYFLYILYSEYPKTYTGITSDVNRRLKEHNDGKSPFTKKFTPWELIYSEKHENRASARLAEKKFKNASGRRRIKEIVEIYKNRTL